MISIFIRGAMLAGALFLAGCGPNKFIDYDGPEVTRVVVVKSQRVMQLHHHGQVLKQYDIDLGFGAVGDKKIEGDGRTPEGRYYIDRRNPNSSFYLSIGINYPNAQDIAEAEALGKPPGGDIFFHGQPNLKRARGPDWTAGCIAVSNREMRQIYAMVKNGTVVDIFP